MAFNIIRLCETKATNVQCLSIPLAITVFGFGPWFKYHDQMLSDLGTLYGSNPADYLDEGIHPNGEGAKKMADLIFKAIK